MLHPQQQNLFHFLKYSRLFPYNKDIRNYKIKIAKQIRRESFLLGKNPIHFLEPVFLQH